MNLAKKGSRNALCSAAATSKYRNAGTADYVPNRGESIEADGVSYCQEWLAV
jgi:hypothetical protein